MSDRSVPHLIKREMAAKGWIQADLADVLGLSRQYVSEILLSRRALSVRVACDLEDAFHIPAHRWLSLQADDEVTEERARRAERNGVKQ